MILVGQLDSPYTRRVAVTLNLLGQPFERSPLSVFADVEEMRRINPLGRVPALVLDDGEVLIDSAAILDHLDEVAEPARRLTPAGGAERRRALRLMALATGAIDKAMGISYERYRRPAERRHGPWLDRLQAQLASALAVLDGENLSPWLLGPSLLQPDVTVACMFGYLRLHVADVVQAGRYPTLEVLCGVAEALPAFADALPSAEEIGGDPAAAQAAIERLRSGVPPSRWRGVRE